jgi:hypothetical protein
MLDEFLLALEQVRGEDIGRMRGNFLCRLDHALPPVEWFTA